ncbi:MAG: PepSY domain-containing protein, partial [Chitinophagaceae bacterium]
MKKYIRKNIYNWHRITSLLIALPVLLWTVSGFLHPVMNSFKPAVKSQSIAPLKIEATKIKISLPDALHQNAIEAINSFRLVQMGDGYYYQLALNSKNEKQYLSCADGKWLKSGDALYAEYLAQQFMNVANKNGDAGHHHGSRNHFKQASNIEAVAATVTEVRQLKSFDAEYKGSQKILPVYKVSFDREDSIRLYVETGTDKMVYAVDRRKAAFSRFFSVAHSWSFLNGMGKAKSVLIGFFSLLCLASSVFGFYIYNISKARKRSAVQKRTWAKRTHRITGNIFLATTMLYAFSGGWHALKKVPDDSGKKGLQYVSSFTPGELHFSLPQLSKNLKAGEQLSNISSI